ISATKLRKSFQIMPSRLTRRRLPGGRRQRCPVLARMIRQSLLCRAMPSSRVSYSGPSHPACSRNRGGRKCGMRLRQAMKAPPARGSWALLASLLLASCASEAPAAAPGGSATAAHETELDVSWGATFGAAAGIKQFEELFNRMYGLSVKINYTPGPSMTDMAGKVTQEVNAGQHSSTDVLLGTESHYAALVDRNVMEEYDYTKLSSRITPEIVAPRNIGVEVGGIVGGIAYNTSLVKAADVPRKLEDVLEPKWKGKIASNPDAALFDRVSARSEWGTDKMMDFVTKLSANVGGLVRCDDNQSVFSGQYLMTVLNCGSYQVRRDQAKGAPIAHTIPPDTATVGF